MSDNAQDASKKAIARLQKKLAQVQMILNTFIIVECLLGLIMLAAPLWLSVVGLEPSASEGFAYMALAPFWFALAFGANTAKKDFSNAKLVFRSNAIAGLGFALISIVGFFTFSLPASFLTFFILSLIIGALAQYVYSQITKMLG